MLYSMEKPSNRRSLQRHTMISSVMVVKFKSDALAPASFVGFPLTPEAHSPHAAHIQQYMQKATFE